MQSIPAGPDEGGREPATGDELLRHATWIRSLARGLVGDAHGADDLVQEAFVAALVRPPERRASLRPWLKQVVLNAARQRGRRSERRARREQDARGPSESPDPSEWAERIETERRLTDALARLDEPFRSTLMLRYYEGLEPTEIARRSGTPAGTVRWRVKRGLELLRERLDGEYGNRSAWSLALLPLARTGTGAATAAGASSIALTGALAMNVLWKATGVAIVTVALTYGLAWMGVVPRSYVPFLSERPASVSFRPLGDESEPAVVEAAAPREPRESVRHVASAAPAAAPEETPQAPAIEPARFQAMIVDASGNPLAGVELHRVGGVGPGGDASAKSGADGRVELVVPMREHEADGTNVQLEFRAPGLASRGEQAVAHAGDELFLGTVVLQPGGGISGQVVDANGAPVENVLITLGDLETPERILERERLSEGFASIPQTWTARDGTFVLRGVPAGFARLWASAPGYLAGYTPPIEVRPGEESYGVAIGLDELADENLVRGIVLDPAGVPVPKARLDFRHTSRSSGTTMAGDRYSDEEGRFEFLLRKDAVLWVTARDPAGEHAPASASNVATGELDLVLQLTDVRRVDLSVLDQAGEPVDRYGFEIVSPDGTFVHASSERAERAGGATTFGRPNERFVVRVDAPGYELAELGPLDPAFLSDTGVELRVAPAPRLRGRVTDSKGPVAGARVRLHRLVGERMLYERNGFRSRLDHNTLPDETETGSDGSYLLTVRSSGTYFVRADRDGYAPSEAGPLELGASAEGRFDLVLGRGGALEGRVILAGGQDAAGRIVGLSRLDGYARTLRVGPGGTYRFDNLTPGPWMLELREEEIVPGRTMTTSSDSRRPTPYAELEWSCDVVEGETTWFDLRLDGAESCRLTGRFQVDGGLEQAWVAKLVPREKMFMEDGVTVVLQPGGTFELAATKPGEYWLTLMRGSQAGGEQIVSDVVRLTAGETSWEAELATGALVVEDVAAWDGEDLPQAVHLWEGPGELMVLTVVAGGPDGVARLPSVPAGPGRVIQPDPTTFEIRTWATLLEVDVPAGAELKTRMR